MLNSYKSADIYEMNPIIRRSKKQNLVNANTYAVWYN